MSAGWTRVNYDQKRDISENEKKLRLRETWGRVRLKYSQLSLERNKEFWWNRTKAGMGGEGRREKAGVWIWKNSFVIRIENRALSWEGVRSASDGIVSWLVVALGIALSLSNPGGGADPDWRRRDLEISEGRRARGEARQFMSLLMR